MEILEKLNVASCYILDFVSGDADEEETLDAVEFAGVDMDTWLISAQSNLSFFGYE